MRNVMCNVAAAIGVLGIGVSGCRPPLQWSTGIVTEVRITPQAQPLPPSRSGDNSGSAAVGAGVGYFLAGPIGAVAGAAVGAGGSASEVDSVAMPGRKRVACSFKLTSPIGEQRFRLTFNPDVLRCTILRNGDELPCFKTEHGIAFRWTRPVTWIVREGKWRESF